MPISPYIKWSEFDSGNNLRVTDTVVGLRAGENMRFTFPGVGIEDSSGNYLYQYATVGAAAVNYLVFTNSAAGLSPSITTAGADSNINITLNPKGSGRIALDALLWPTGAGTSGYVLTTDGASSTSWASVSSLGAVTSVSGTAGRITSTGGTTPVIDIDAAYVGQTSIVTLGTVTTGTWSATNIALNKGGTNAALTASNGGIFYSTATAGAILAGTATAGKVLQSGATAAPTWSTPTYPSASGSVGTILRSDGTNNVYTTATYPATTTANQILYSSSASVIGEITTAANGVLITSAGSVPSISSTLPSAVQGNITSVGTIASGTWNGSVIGLAYGGTNANITAAAGAVAYSTAGAIALTAAGTSGQVLTSAGAGTPTWTTPTTGTVTSVSGTAGRITSSGGATPVIDIDAAYVGQTSIVTLGTVATGTWTASVIGLTYGGTGKALTANNGGIVWTDADSMEVLAGTATAGQMLRSGATATPAWSTATFPATATGAGTILRADGTNWVASTATFANTYAVSTLLYAASSDTVSGLATANRSVLTTGATGVPAWASLGTDGQVIIGSSAGTPTGATLTAGTGVTITNASNSITIAASGGGLTWSTVAGTTQSASVGNGYIIGNASQTTITLPATFAIGDTVAIRGLGAGGWILTANTGDVIHIGQAPTSAGGTVTSAANYDTITVEGLVANTDWTMSASVTSGFTVA